MKYSRTNDVISFLHTPFTDPTFLTVEFGINPSSILFNNENTAIISPGEITSYDINNTLITQTEGLVVTPAMLLYHLNEQLRYSQFNNFIEGFKYFTEKEPWRIQKIEGLDAIFAKDINYKDGFTGSGQDKITITCLEDVNLSMWSLFDLYKNCVYDYRTKRQILPNNILQFECYINIYDVRELIHYSNIDYSDDITPKIDVNKPTTASFTYSGGESIAKTHFKKGEHFIKPIITIYFSNCHFDLSSLGKTAENVSISEDFTPATFTFEFTYGKAFINRTYSSHQAYRGDIDREDKIEDEYKKAFNNTKYTNDLYADTTEGVGKKSMGSSLTENLNNKKDQFGNEIQSRATQVANAPKKAVEENLYGAINKASSAISEGIDTVAQQIEGKLNEAINTLTNEITKSTGKFVGFNIFENLPSGPKK